jgi:type VI secretion system protein ImpC
MDHRPDKKSLIDAVSECTPQLEAELTDGLDKLLHSPEVQALEATWRALHYLVCECETSELLKVRVFNISEKELLKDFQKAVDFDQTSLYKRIWEDGYGLYGGEPVGCLVADFAFDNSPRHTQILQHASDLAIAARMPFLAAAAPTLFQARNWNEAVLPEDLNQLFDSPEYARWRSFRSRPESGHVVLALPRILLRVPYGPGSDPIDEIDFSESATTDADFLWGNPAFFIAASIGNAFAGRESNKQEVNWDGLGHIEGYLYHVNEDSDNGLQMTGPLERSFARHEQRQFADAGFCALSVEDDGLGAVTADLRTSVSLEALGSASEEPAFAQLELVLAAARLVHALPSVLRESAGSFADKSECEAFLDRNIHQILGRGDDKSAGGTLLRSLRDVESQVIASGTSAKADSVAWGQSAEVAIRLSIDAENTEGGVRDVRFSVALPPTVTDWRLF